MAFNFTSFFTNAQYTVIKSILSISAPILKGSELHFVPTATTVTAMPRGEISLEDELIGATKNKDFTTLSSSENILEQNQLNRRRNLSTYLSSKKETREHNVNCETKRSSMVTEL